METSARAYEDFLRLLGDELSLDVHFETSPQEIGERVYRRMAEWSRMRAKAESPIELLLGVHLLFVNDGFVTLVPSESVTEKDHASGDLVILHQQYRAGKFRADFALEACFGARQIILVECDGHDFHERTKEQASRDKQRDRELVMAGYKVLRYTGSEIYRNTPDCAWELVGICSNALRDTEGR